MINISIYQPNYLSLNNQTVDALEIIEFSCTVQGNLYDAYQLKIYNMSNVLIYDSTKILLSPSLYQDDILTHELTASTLTNGTQYFYTFTVYQGTTSVTSKQTTFYCYGNPTVSMVVPSEITSKKHLFTATYSQAESISSNTWNMTFLDSNDEIIFTTPNSYSGNLSYEFDGFISGNAYSVYTTITNQQNVTIQSPIYTFTTTYASPSLITVPIATLLPDLSATKIEWSPAVQVTGVIIGESEYLSGLFISANTGLKLGIIWDDIDTVDDTIIFDEADIYDESYGASILFNDLFGKSNDPNYVEFEVDIPEKFTLTIDYIPSVSFQGGKMIRLENISGSYFEIGYNPEIGCYYYDNNGFVLNSIPKEFLTNPCLIAIKGVEVLIISNNIIYDYIRPQ